MNHLDLFSGIGGFSLALEKVGFKTIAFCENDPYCRLLLQKHWKGVTIHNDIKKLEAKDIKEPIDILTGGFPCQPYSVAGKQKGTDDNRYLWPDMFRIIKEVKPTFVIAERMCEELLTSKTAWYSRQCALTWKLKVSKSNRLLFQRRRQRAPQKRTSLDCGLLQTQWITYRQDQKKEQ